MLIQCLSRQYPQFPQSEIFSLQDAFRKLDVEDKGYLDEASVIKATQQSERQSYDVVRQALKEVGLDSSRRVELEDYLNVSCALLGTPSQKLFLIHGKSLSPRCEIHRRHSSTCLRVQPSTVA